MRVSSSPAVKRRRSSYSARSASTDKDDVPPPRTRTVAEDKSPMFNQSSADCPASRSSSELPSKKESSMNPRVSISPLRSDVVRPAKKSKGRTARRVKPLAGSDKGKLKRRVASSFEKGKPSSDSEDEDKLSSPGSERDQSDVPARRRSRNIQLTSLFDSLTRFFSADSDRRRRTAYVNATVSLAQSSLNPRHSFTSVPPEPQTAPQPITPKPPRHQSSQPTVQKPRQTSPQPASQKPRQQPTPQPIMKQPEPTPQPIMKQPAKLPSPAPDKTKGKRGRNKSTKTVKRPAKSETVKDLVTKCSSLTPTDTVEMKDLLTASVAESESKLFDTAQTIAQQVTCSVYVVCCVI